MTELWRRIDESEEGPPRVWTFGPWAFEKVTEEAVLIEDRNRALDKMTTRLYRCGIPERIARMLARDLLNDAAGEQP